MIFRAENVGSLLRPAYLADARARLAEGTLPPREFKAIEDRAVDEAVALQAAAGLDVITDGEMRRLVFSGSLMDVVDGIEGPPPPPMHWHGSEEYGSDDRIYAVPAHTISGELRRVRSIATEEFTYLRTRTDRPTKATLASPLMLGQRWHPELSREVYADPFDAFAAATEILAQEIRELARLGCEYVQIDAPEIASLADPALRDRYDRLGIGADRMLAEGIELIDGLTAAVDSGVTFGLHLCRGNNEGRWLAEGGYERISEQVFRRATGFDVLLLEYDDARSGGFEPLGGVPEHQVVVLGLVSSKLPLVEEDDEIVARIEQASAFVPLERLALSCQCGFASTAGGNRVTPEAQRAKLELVSRVARRVW
jgi:5-methyltetrahydropteroyltriglutamate--homocysteine methyltransferase